MLSSELCRRCACEADFGGCNGVGSGVDLSSFLEAIFWARMLAIGDRLRLDRHATVTYHRRQIEGKLALHAGQKMNGNCAGVGVAALGIIILASKGRIRRVEQRRVVSESYCR
jgi:hypothetical protein